MKPVYRLMAISLVFHVCALWLGYRVVKCSTAQAHELKRAAELSEFTNKVTTTVVKAGNRAVAWGLGWLHVDPPPQEKDEYEEVIAMAAEYGRQAMVMSLLLAAITAGFLAFLHLGVRDSMEDGTCATRPPCSSWSVSAPSQ
jgi:hypothetical protein